MGGQGSGRKTRYQELQDGNLLKLCTDWLIENFNTFDKKTKIKTATEIAKKGVTNKHEHKGDIDLKGLLSGNTTSEEEATGDI